MSTPLNDDRLAEIRNRRLEEVTAGPWLVADVEDGSACVYVEVETGQERPGARVLLVADKASEADVQFVTSARDSVPELLAEVDRLRAELAKYIGVEPTVAEELTYLKHCLDSVLALCDDAEKQATRWENPLAVPEWVEQVRKAAEGSTS